MTRTVTFFIALLWLFPAHAAPLPPPPDVAASAWILMDADTGRVLTEQAADEALPPASLTKLMTSYVLSSELAMGRVSNEDMVNV
ncbi:MAG: serine-type D-Ala-D-Ala carboxypeptidase, partial [Halieaceae bacterium]|nr:serine-type D-Ala-D-Ala carboxypeptidase [Halieaceae bacterium]